MKKTIIILILALLITLIAFETMSWYHIGDIPTQIVLIRLIIFFITVSIILMSIFYLIKKLKK